MVEPDKLSRQNMDHLDEFDFFSVSAPYRAKFPKRKFNAGIYLIVGGAALVYFLQTLHSSLFSEDVWFMIQFFEHHYILATGLVVGVVGFFISLVECAILAFRVWQEFHGFYSELDDWQWVKGRKTRPGSTSVADVVISSRSLTASIKRKQFKEKSLNDF